MKTKKVKCIDTNGYGYLTEGKIYTVVSESFVTYEIICDAHCEISYRKIYFVLVTEDYQIF